MKRHPWLAAFFVFGTTMCTLTGALLSLSAARLLEKAVTFAQTC
jgi:hypothetical protein